MTSDYEYMVGIAVLLVVMLIIKKPKSGMSKRVHSEERDSIIQLCNEEPNIIEYVSLLDTLGKEVVCELKLKDREPVRLDSGVNATGTWLRLKALKNGSELPEYLLHNE